MKQVPKVTVLVQLLESGDITIQSTSQNRITTLGLLEAAKGLVMQMPKAQESSIVIPELVK